MRNEVLTVDKEGTPIDKITDFLGKKMRVELKNHHTVTGILSFYHLTEQMIHLNNWMESDANGQPVRSGRYVVINRTAWFQLFAEEDPKTKD